MGPEMMNEFRAQAERFDALRHRRRRTGRAHRRRRAARLHRRSGARREERRPRHGAEPRRLGIPGEMELAGRGVDLRRLRRRLLQGPEGGRDRRRRLGDGGLDLHLQVRRTSMSSTGATSSVRRRSCSTGRGNSPTSASRPRTSPRSSSPATTASCARSRSAGPTTASRRAWRWAAHSSRSATSRAPSWWPSRWTSTTRATCSPTAARRARTRRRVRGRRPRRPHLPPGGHRRGHGLHGALDAEWYLRDTPPSPEAHWQRGGEPVEVAPQLAASGE